MTPSFRIGFGFDVHRMVSGRKFILGGMDIPHGKGLAGHSDADVLIHAICDALLGAAGLRDIGFYFPDTDAAFKNIDSTVLLKEVCGLLQEKKFSIGNIDTTVVLEEPRVNIHTGSIIEKLGGLMGISPDRISVKATTNEQMGFIGRKEGVAAYAIALIFQS
ncbi:MAG: 2-C-methyl-D-erythritol 2,4-cyclodiphosphate synthase [Chitinophagales bacterium]